jgi:hypothetical protein
MAQAAKLYRIVSDGTPHGTVIYNPDGDRIPYVTEMVIHINAKESFVQLTKVKIGDIRMLPRIPIAELDIEVPARQVMVKEVTAKSLIKKRDPAE